MKRTLLFSTFLVGFYVLIMSLTLSNRDAAGYENCGCHPDKADKPFVHKPVGEGKCELCHKPSGQKHPRFKKEAFLLPDNGKAGLCIECHESKNTMKSVHDPVGKGDCLACHEIHDSNNKSQLKAPGGQLCFMCHEKAKFDRQHPHKPIAEANCTGCHDPHQSNVKYMLKGEGKQLCVICHNKKTFTGRSVHGPILKNDCEACHVTHGTSFANLLKKDFPEEFYMPFSKEKYAFCFICHNNKMADDLDTETQTNFRNGNINIHYIHIKKNEKGRSCKTCHDPHSAKQLRLIPDKIPGFGKWGIPIRYTKTNNGGTCVVGCHKPKSYDRINPVHNP